MSMYYEVGGTVTFIATARGDVLTAQVDARVDNLLDGRPGFIATTDDDLRVWGLDSEIIDVYPTPAEARARKIIELRRLAQDRHVDSNTARSYLAEVERLEQQAREETDAPAQ